MSEPEAESENDAAYQKGYQQGRKDEESDWDVQKDFRNLLCEEARAVSAMLEALGPYDGGNDREEMNARNELCETIIYLARQMRGDA
jgi:hypothetical protein